MKKLFVFLMLMGSLVGFSQVNFFNKKRYDVKKSHNTKKRGEDKVVKEDEDKRLREFVHPGWKVTDYGMVEPNFNKKLVLLEVAHLLDSIREYMYMCDLLVTQVDSIASRGAEHHNKYLRSLVNPNKPNGVHLTHGEFKVQDNWIYPGKDTLIPQWDNRMEHFTDGSMGFCGEVCSAGPLSLISYKGLSPKEIAKHIVYGFHHSKEHWKILTYYGYTKIAADIQIRKNPDGEYDYWFTLATGCNIIITKTTHKNEFYYPGNTFGFTEYYDIVDKNYVFNRVD